MKKKVRRARRGLRKAILFHRVMLWTIFLILFAAADIRAALIQKTQILHVYLNDVPVGTLMPQTDLEDLLLQARRQAAARADDILYVVPRLSVEEEAVYWARTDSASLVKDNMVQVLLSDRLPVEEKAYTVKIGEYIIHLPSLEDVQMMLEAGIAPYDADQQFTISVAGDQSRDFHVLTADVIPVEEKSTAVKDLFPAAGAAKLLQAMRGQFTKDSEDMDFSEFSLGTNEISYGRKIEIAEGYMPALLISSADQAIADVTRETQTEAVYEVQPGDTLSQIALNLNLPLDTLLEMNGETLDNEKSIIRAGDKLIYSKPKQTFLIRHTQTEYIEETYDAPTVYIDRNDWYTNQTSVVTQPSAGFRKAIWKISFENDKIVNREICKEEVVMEAVAKVVERGTITPPTYIKPISGGRLSSGFGKRSAPTKGASTYHKGVDWATPVGTPVYASCGGKVVRAGWGSGYGYCVYIEHPDGRQTRYGHCSKVLVSEGDTVKQGDKIALSGNTGVSTGAHLHFEILIGGSQVNPLNYLQ